LIRNQEYIIDDIKTLVKSKGFIYTLCLILIEDFHFNVEKLHEVDYQSRLNKNEISFLIGLLIQKPISLEKPSSPLELIELKKSTHSLMYELHTSTMLPMFDKMEKVLRSKSEEEIPEKLDFFGGENTFVEPIFYAGDGIYDFQYLEFLEKKYQYDEEWLKNNANFRFKDVIQITNQIKQIHQEKFKKVNLLGIRENRKKIIKKIKKKNRSKKNKPIDAEEYIAMLELYQFFDLFETDSHINKGLQKEDVTNEGWNSFYSGLIDIFSVKLSDFDEKINFLSFIQNFSIPKNSKNRNKQFKSIGDFNQFKARPLIPLSADTFFVPITFSVFEAVYESPYYWMLLDKTYNDKLAFNRGKAGEEITYELLKSVFGKNRTFNSVRIELKKGQDGTDIDVLCILGSKALCVQVKSKKLTQLSRKGDFEQLKRDFKGAVQDAYNQGLICRSQIIENSATFYNHEGLKIELSEDIEEVYLMVVTTENYPSLTHQSFAFLEKNDEDPSPLVLTIFDLELVLYYLDNPYDFLYYVRQRTTLTDCFNAQEEMHYLGYHLTHKLWKESKYAFIQLDNSFGQLIDRNYYPYKLGIETSAKSDKIKTRWKNKDFETLCSQIENLNFPKSTDVIFHLLDYSQESRENLIKFIHKTKSNAFKDGEEHNFSMLSGPKRSTFGLTYLVSKSNDPHELIERIGQLSHWRKYKSKADFWIGLGCVNLSERMVDVLVYSNKKWEFNKTLDQEVKIAFQGKNKGIPYKFGKKVQRNDPCPCGSAKKYKKCCGRN
tara:strand:- start:8241 stop:10559 length:2319 start_codon:yes stop_codon:yes gene_type:complete